MQKSSIVICLDDNFSPSQISMFDKLPVKGELYMVREIMPALFGPTDKPGLTLEGIHGKLVTYRDSEGGLHSIEFHFIIERFKEVVPPFDLELFKFEKEIFQDIV